MSTTAAITSSVDSSYSQSSMNINSSSSSISLISSSPQSRTLHRVKSNMEFCPTPTTPAKCNYVKLNIHLTKSVYIAGSTIHGYLEIDISAAKSLLLGEISISLQAREEVANTDIPISHIFQTSKVIIQNEKTPPAIDIVHGPRQFGGFWEAKGGRIKKPFSFDIPLDAPGSFQFQKHASVVYTVTGSAQFQLNGVTDITFTTKEATVLECWNGIIKDFQIDRPFQSRSNKLTKFGGDKPVELCVTLPKTCYVSGSVIDLNVRVKNPTKLKVHGLKVAIVRKLSWSSDEKKSSEKCLDFKTIVDAEQNLRDREFIYEPGEFRDHQLQMPIPLFTRGLKNTVHFDVSCQLQIGLYTGLFQNNIVIEIPLHICNPASLEIPEKYVHPIQDENSCILPDLKPDSHSESITSSSFQILCRKYDRRILPWSDHHHDVDFLNTELQSSQNHQKEGNKTVSETDILDQLQKLSNPIMSTSIFYNDIIQDDQPKFTNAIHNLSIVNNSRAFQKLANETRDHFSASSSSTNSINASSSSVNSTEREEQSLKTHNQLQSHVYILQQKTEPQVIHNIHNASSGSCDAIIESHSHSPLSAPTTKSKAAPPIPPRPQKSLANKHHSSSPLNQKSTLLQSDNFPVVKDVSYSSSFASNYEDQSIKVVPMSPLITATLSKYLHASSARPKRAR